MIGGVSYFHVIRKAKNIPLYRCHMQQWQMSVSEVTCVSIVVNKHHKADMQHL